MHAHRVDILDGADDDAVVGDIADDLHLVLLPAQHAFLDEDLGGGGKVEAAFNDLAELFHVVSDAAAGAGQGEGRADNGRQTDERLGLQRLFQGVDGPRFWALQTDGVHGVAEFLAVLGLVDDIGPGADHLDAEFLQHAHALKAERGVQGRLAAHGRQKRVWAFLFDDFGDDFRGDRLDIGGVGDLGVGHDGGRVGVDQNDPVALGAQGLAGLNAGIVELAGLADDDRSGADDQDGFDIGAFGHSRP